MRTTQRVAGFEDMAQAALPWLIRALQFAHLDKRILNAGRMLLAKERFTRNLTFLGVLDELQEQMCVAASHTHTHTHTSVRTTARGADVNNANA